MHDLPECSVTHVTAVHLHSCASVVTDAVCNMYCTRRPLAGNMTGN